MKKFLCVTVLLVFLVTAGAGMVSAQTQAEGIKVALIKSPPGKDLGGTCALVGL